MPRKQVNIGFRPEDYEELLAAADAAGQDVTGFVRAAALNAMRSPVSTRPPAPAYDPMDLIRVGYVLAEAQHAQRPRWWQFWRRQAPPLPAPVGRPPLEIVEAEAV